MKKITCMYCGKEIKIGDKFGILTDSEGDTIECEACFERDRDREQTLTQDYIDRNFRNRF